MQDDSETLPADGRHARSVRARRTVVEAYLDLLNSGELRPTAARVAERAGVSLRLVFHHFADLETLYSEVADRQTERLQHLMRPVDPLLPFGERVAKFVLQRTTLLETIAPVRRAALLQEPFSTTLAKRLSRARTMTREEVRRTFAAELAPLSPRERREVLAGLDSAAGFMAWESLRRHQRLSIALARSVMKRTISALLSADTARPEGRRKISNECDLADS